jgi:nucleoside-diphosphate-sugar epimerase
LVTGGASFIGSHLVERLVERGARVRVADDLSSGRLEHLGQVLDRIEFLELNLKNWDQALKASAGCDRVFHLAADHGGRGYIASHPANCATNMALDNIVFETAVQNEVSHITFASSACVYPTALQQEKRLLTEEMVSFDRPGGAFADEEYGWAKLMGELSLRAFHRQFGVGAACVRISTAYGPRENETHAVIALLAKALAKQDPFEIWGDGEQTRGFTYVTDIVNVLILASERISNAAPVNAGSDQFNSLNELAELIFELVEWRPKQISHLNQKPVGVIHRALDGSLTEELLGFRPEVGLSDGMKLTAEDYRALWSVEKRDLDKALMER